MHANDRLEKRTTIRRAEASVDGSTYPYVVVHKTAHAAELPKMISWAITVGQQPAVHLRQAVDEQKVVVVVGKTLKQITAG